MVLADTSDTNGYSTKTNKGRSTPKKWLLDLKMMVVRNIQQQVVVASRAHLILRVLWECDHNFQNNRDDRCKQPRAWSFKLSEHLW